MFIYLTGSSRHSCGTASSFGAARDGNLFLELLFIPSPPLDPPFFSTSYAFIASTQGMEILLVIVIVAFRAVGYIITIPIRVHQAWYSIQQWHRLKLARLPKPKKRKSRNAATQHAQQSSPFLRLPAELRLRIYQLAVHSEEK
jgi:hypothetical protein